MSDVASPRDLNLEWFVHYVKVRAARSSVRAVLDFGCGDGRTVRMLREHAVDAYGADVFYGGGRWDQGELAEMLSAGTVRRIEDGVLPFADGAFDVIVSDMVLEHILDWAPALRELERVLAPGGVLYCQFPTTEGLREGHLGLPLVHWFPPGRARFLWTVALRGAGLGFHKRGMPGVVAWTRWKLEWLDTWCHYRSTAEADQLLGQRFSVTHRELEYCRFRASGRPVIGRLLRIRALQRVWRRAFRRLGFVAVELRPRHGAPAS